MAHWPNPAGQKKIIRLAISAIAAVCRNIELCCQWSTHKSEILGLDIAYKNILNENKHATVSMFCSVYLASKILINESHQPIKICKIFNRLRAIRPKGLRAGSLQAR